MRLTKLARIILFLSSYGPLWLIFFVNSYSTWAGWISLALGVLGTGAAILLLSRTKGAASVPLKVAKVRRKDSDTMGYIATYVLPFAATKPDDPVQMISLLIFFVALASIYVNSGLIHINPTLSILGYRIFEVEDGSENAYPVITKRAIRKDDILQLVDVADGVFVEKAA